ncbi:MAG: hypothetical protein ACKO6N_01130 [Myxococcota bacterium]
MPCLMYTKPGKEPMWFELRDGQLLGEGDGCQLSLGPASPARYFARVRLEGDHVWLEVLLPGSLRLDGLQEELLDLEDGAQITVEPLQINLQYYRVRPALPALPLRVEASGTSPSSPPPPDVRAEAVVSRTVPRAATAPSPFELRPMFPYIGSMIGSMSAPASSAPPSFILGELGEVTLPIPPESLPSVGAVVDEDLLTEKVVSAERREGPAQRCMPSDDVPAALSLRRTDPMPPPVPPTLFLAAAASHSKRTITHGEVEPEELTHVMEVTQHSWRTLPELALDEEPSEVQMAMKPEQHSPAPVHLPASPAGTKAGQELPESAEVSSVEASVAARTSRFAPMRTEFSQKVTVAPQSFAALAQDHPTARGAKPNHTSVRRAEAQVSAAERASVQRLMTSAPVLAEQAQEDGQEDGGWWSWLTQFLWGLALVLVGAVILVVLERL